MIWRGSGVYEQQLQNLTSNECFMKRFGICQLNRTQITIIPAHKQVLILQMEVCMFGAFIVEIK